MEKRQVKQEFSADVTVVGGGVAGLWTAKELIDQGYGVQVVEKSDELASGATTRNEGWLHAGAYHSVAIYNERDAEMVTERTRYGHDAIVNFAPESIEHSATYAFTATDELAQSATERWQKFGINYREVSPQQFEEDGIDTTRVRAAFEVDDKSVNSRTMCRKLAKYILENGGSISTNADFMPHDSTTASMVIDGDNRALHSDAFVIAAGVGTKGVVEEVTGTPFPMRYFKSHLLVAPRLTRDNYFYVDPMEAGIMSHGNASIIGINREAIEADVPNYEVIGATEQLVFSALTRMLPQASKYSFDTGEILSVACIKADVADDDIVRQADSSHVLQDLNIKAFEVAENYICAVPGKMTESPALARAVVGLIEGGGEKSLRVIGDDANIIPNIRERPADLWMRERGL